MQMLYPRSVSIQQYVEQADDPGACRPARCPQCETKEPMTAHGFYNRTIVDAAFDGVIRVRRYLCTRCRRTVSLLPEWALPYVRFSIPVIARVLKARLMESLAWEAVAAMPYQRGQYWVRRFIKQAVGLSAALQALTEGTPALSFVSRALGMLEKTGWIEAHRFLFQDLRMHLLGWGCSLAPHGRRVSVNTASRLVGVVPHSTCMETEVPSG